MPINKAKTAKAVGIGTALSLAGILLVLCVICGILMMLPTVPTGSMPYLALIAVALGTLTGGYIAAAIAGSKGLLTGALCGAVVFLCLAVFGLCSGSFQPGVMSVLRAAVSIVSGGIGGIKGVNRKEKLHIK